eukprot:GDKK01072116.1.p1 GENE.GDKK01072116.1~~GDKK01072116.1.p1  ORF type:complete len:833 (+),score=185.41 GDKK01072116.1:1-2499(+)
MGITLMNIDHLYSTGVQTGVVSNVNHLQQNSSQKQWLLTPIDFPSFLSISQADVELLHSAHHADVFSVLGAHHVRRDNISYVVVRAWVKDATNLKVSFAQNGMFSISGNQKEIDTVRRAAWLFEVAFSLSSDLSNEHYEIIPKFHVQYPKDDTTHTLGDAFSVPLLLPKYDLDMFQSGSCWKVDDLLGSHFMTVQTNYGCRFSVWAPNAKFVSVVGDFNQWDGRAHPMRLRHEYGVWEIFIPTICTYGQAYSYRIHTQANMDMIKIDPYAQEMQVPPLHASLLSACDDSFKPANEKYEWLDSEWMKNREKKNWIKSPMSIYEVHLGSWMRGEGNRKLSFKELADRLVQHVKKMNMTHVEFLPVTWHPFDGSWGYQCLGFYAPCAELGTADELKYLIDRLHQNEIGVILDVVPAHFAKDVWGLYDYDGSPCYEYADPREGEHYGWGTRAFNFKRNEVRSFILGSIYHWIRRYHVDGLRVDAVSSMIYKSYQRDHGEWLPNEYGGEGNIEAINLLKELNYVVKTQFKGVITIAEESTSFPDITDLNYQHRQAEIDKVNQESNEKVKNEISTLGFDLKWDLGWMNDSLSYLTYPPDRRGDMHSKLTFRGIYMGDERWILPLSHDEVVSGKGSLVDKCGFKDTPFEERLAAIKALFGFQVGSPGRPLLFMGAEWAQGKEWIAKQSLDWHELQEDGRKRVFEWVCDLMSCYKAERAFWNDCDAGFMTFRWVDVNSPNNALIAFIRSDRENANNDILIIVNFSGNNYYDYQFGVPYCGDWTVLLNSDDWKYGGQMFGLGQGGRINAIKGGVFGWDASIKVNVGKNSCLFIKAPKEARW